MVEEEIERGLQSSRARKGVGRRRESSKKNPQPEGNWTWILREPENRTLTPPRIAGKRLPSLYFIGTAC